MILKIRTVNGGGNLVRDKTTSLWHHDVERIPFTGRAIEYQEGRIPLAEAYFYNGQRDGTERFLVFKWKHENGKSLVQRKKKWFL